MHDLIIRNAEVFDGTGLAPVLSDVAVSNGRISQIGHITELAHETIDAKGLALMPGIVDLHTHYDAQVTWDRTMSPSPALGVTTAVIGNCGFGIAPCPAPLQETMLKNLSVVEGMDLNSLLTGVNWEFESFGQYMDQLRRIGPYINTAVFAGHSVIRTAVMGAEGSSKVDPSPEQLQTMQSMVRDAMDHGAIGFASSFSPNHSGYGGLPMPSTIASETELRALTAILGEKKKGVFIDTECATRSAELQASGFTVVLVVLDGRPLGLIALTDKIKESTKPAIDALHALGLKFKMLTGDTRSTADRVAKDLRIDEVAAELSPHDKLVHVYQMKEQGRKAAYVGDGINDAPALSGAEVGIAMGTGTDAAMHSASVTLVKGDLRALHRAFTLSRATLRIIRQNLAFSFLYNAIGILIAAGVLYPFTGRLLSPMLASVAMSLSSLTVILNSLRLRWFK
jgi:soluble P-type ATPase